jgi:putative sigma-54 modulation protein
MAMKIEIKGKNIEMTERIQSYVTKKVTKLERYLPGIEEVHVELNYLKSARSAADRQVVEITARGKGFILRTEERSSDIFAAIDTALDKMQKQIERYKGKHYHGRGDGRSAAEVTNQPVPEEETTDELGPAIIRRKRFLLTPMDELEALEQMKLLGHDNFFVFYNVKTNAVDVIYKRHDGTYGLIETEIG